MTPAEVLAMRDRLAEEMWEAKLGVCYDDCVSVADWLLTSRLTREKIAVEMRRRLVHMGGDWRELDSVELSEWVADAILALLTEEDHGSNT